jgi:hypothetical protein
MSKGLDRFGYFAGPEAACAHTNVLTRTADLNVHPLEVGPLDALGFDVRVANSVGHLSLFTANFTLRWHGFSGGGYH